MSRFTEVRHYLEGDYGFSVGLTFDKWRDDLKFECFMIVSIYSWEPLAPIYLVRGHEIGLAEYFSSDSHTAWQTEKIDEAQPIMSGHFEVDSWVGIRFEVPSLYFHDKMQWLKFAKLIFDPNRVRRRAGR